MSVFDYFGCNCGSSEKRHHRKRFRVVGGKAASKSIKWIAYVELIRGNKAEFCTGSLINTRYVVSAAHCVCSPKIAPDACTKKYHAAGHTAEGYFDAVDVNYDPVAVGTRVFLGLKNRAELDTAESWPVMQIKVSF